MRDVIAESVRRVPQKKLGQGLVFLWGNSFPTVHHSAPKISIHARLPEGHV